MKLTIVKIASVGIILSVSVLPAQAEWLSYVIRTSGLGWSDGYHAYDQCPPKAHKHFPIKHPFVLPGYGASPPRHTPYYFEEKGPDEILPVAPQLPNPAASGAQDFGAPQAPMNHQLDPQARYKPHSRYFAALQTQSQGSDLQVQAPAQQARRTQSATADRPPF